MVAFSTTALWEDPDPALQKGRVGVLCNQAAWHPETGEYLFEIFGNRGNLKRLFMPEHGLFGELQDQVKLDGGDVYKSLGFRDCEYVSLYGSGEASLRAAAEKLSDLDALVIELQDVGVRYYTFLSTLRNLFITLKEKNISLPVWVLDRENPAGLSVEGSALEPTFASFIGIPGIPHRYGLSIGEMAQYLYAETGADFPLHIVSKDLSLTPLYPWVIAPSPNIPGFYTADFYSGQCLWEGTNVSEGRGTTRPFEVFGAPWMENLAEYNRKQGFSNWNDPKHPLNDPGAFLRWHFFIPTFHKYQDQRCFGFQLIRNPGKPYHALLHALKQLRFLSENCPDFAWRPGKYEAGNDKTAIELLAGDKFLLEYLDSGGNPEEIRDYLGKEEKKWISQVQKYLLYGEKLYSAAAAAAV
jgi:uncharacterized protein YbbC (DUF1343 family)